MADLGPTIARAKEALRQRIDQAVPHLLGVAETESLSTMELLSLLAKSVRVDNDRAGFWLLMACVAGAMPTREQVVRGYRFLELAPEGTEHLELLRACAGASSLNENFDRWVTVISDTVVADVDFCARHGHNTGVQRVVRETLARWNAVHDVTLVAWTEDGFLMRSLIPAETDRVLDWVSSRRTESSPASAEDDAQLIIPWNCSVVLPEVAQHRIWERLACLAEFSSNTVSMVGYDAIPVTSAEYVISSESERFVRYLSIVKHADLVVGISKSSSEEFAGFADALTAQGLRGPRVITVSLPIALAREESALTDISERSRRVPLVLCVGTQEPRKNQLAVLAASELLWKRGMAFEVLFIGGAAMPLSIPFDIEVDRLRRLGRSVSVIRNGSDAILERAYRDARFSMFVSLHEGFGLPIGESLAVGTPVIATDYGSMAEIANGGGCLVVDPRNDESIAEAMRILLTDDIELDRLEHEALARPSRTWDDYSAELWSAISEGVPTR
ncbi:MAG: glycosyltransferase [Kineosporiaceae bacterium]|nr:glycosyltransferase [Aeromicrobium sp.]